MTAEGSPARTSAEALLDAPGQRDRHGQAEPAGHLSGAEAPWQLEQGEQVAVGFGHDAIQHRLIEPIGKYQSKQCPCICRRSSLRRPSRGGRGPRRAASRTPETKYDSLVHEAPRTRNRAPVRRPDRATERRQLRIAVVGPQPTPTAEGSTASATRRPIWRVAAAQAEDHTEAARWLRSGSLSRRSGPWQHSLLEVYAECQLQFSLFFPQS